MKKESKLLDKKTREFSLPRFFNIFSLGIVIISTILLTFIFLNNQKKLIVTHHLKMAESYAHQLNYEISNKYEFDIVQYGTHWTIDKSKIRFRELDTVIRNFLQNYNNIIKIKIYDRDGEVVYSTDKENIGETIQSFNFYHALDTGISSELTNKMTPLKDATEKGKVYKADILEVYIPTLSSEHDSQNNIKSEMSLVTGVFEIYQDITPMFSVIEKEAIRIGGYVFIAMIALFVFLYIVIRKADQIITRKNLEIEKNSTELEEAQTRIKESIDEVIEHGSFHVRIQSSHLKHCWEVKNCTATQCPSYKSEDLRCWQVAGTYCKGKVQGVFAAKFGDCKKCEIYQHAFRDRINLIGESFNNMMTMLQNKHLELESLNKKLNTMVDTDALTGIGNRRSFQKRVEYIHLMSLRYNHPYSIIICDIDNFKLYNDSYGHQQGDYALISTSKTMQDTIRKTDEIFRWGGEEFVIILPEQNHASALKVAETLRMSIESLGIEHAKSSSGILTMSFGVAANFLDRVNYISWDAVLREADVQLYNAKSNGRNRVYPLVKKSGTSNA